MERFTSYGHNAAGTLKHTITAEGDVTGWTLTLTAMPIQPAISHPERNGESVGSAAWQAGILCQQTEVASRRAPRTWIAMPEGPMELRPSEEARALAQDVLGTAWTVVDKGKGYLVEVAW